MAEGIALTILDGFEVQGLVALGIALGFGLLLIRGGAVVWVLILFGVILQMLSPLTVEEPLWRSLTSLFVLGCLLSPSVRQFVWRNGRRRPIRDVSGVPYAGLGWIHAAGLGLKDRFFERKPIPGVSGSLIWRLIFILAISVPLVGEFADYRDGDGRDVLLVEIGWRIVWSAFNLLQVVIVILLLVAAYNHFLVRPQTKALD